jgi:hypothetical protein
MLMQLVSTLQKPLYDAYHLRLLIQRDSLNSVSSQSQESEVHVLYS